MLLTDLPQAVAKSGLPVVEVGGWRTRGHGALAAVETIVCHHTATPSTAPGDYPSLAIVRDGRADLSGPLCNLGLGRSGTVYIVAAGVAFHAGDVWTESQDNWHSIGIEAEHNGITPWPPELVDAYARLCAALADHYGLTVARVQGHKEVAKPAGRKTDPNFDMTSFRARVTAHLEDDMPLSTEDLDKVRAIVREEIDATRVPSADGKTTQKLSAAVQRLLKLVKD